MFQFFIQDNKSFWWAKEMLTTLSAEAVEYANCISTEG